MVSVLLKETAAKMRLDTYVGKGVYTMPWAKGKRVILVRPAVSGTELLVRTTSRKRAASELSWGSTLQCWEPMIRM